MKVALLYYYYPATDGPSEGEVGAYVYEAGFHPAETAKTVSAREDQDTVEDGAVAGAGDVLAGLYVLEVADMDAALGWARRIPTAGYGKVEARPIVEFPS